MEPALNRGMATVYRAALYSFEGDLVRSSLAFPVEVPPRPQPVADLMALAAESGCGEHVEGDILIWVNRDVEPPARIELAEPDAARSFGGCVPPVPRYRWRRGHDWTITLTPVS